VVFVGGLPGLAVNIASGVDAGNSVGRSGEGEVRKRSNWGGRRRTKYYSRSHAKYFPPIARLFALNLESRRNTTREQRFL
jgi:hypothetical protein